MYKPQNTLDLIAVFFGIILGLFLRILLISIPVAIAGVIITLIVKYLFF